MEDVQALLTSWQGPGWSLAGARRRLVSCRAGGAPLPISGGSGSSRAGRRRDRVIVGQSTEPGHQPILSAVRHRRAAAPLHRVDQRCPHRPEDRSGVVRRLDEVVGVPGRPTLETAHGVGAHLLAFVWRQDSVHRAGQCTQSVSWHSVQNSSSRAHEARQAMSSRTTPPVPVVSAVCHDRREVKRSPDRTSRPVPHRRPVLPMAPHPSPTTAGRAVTPARSPT